MATATGAWIIPTKTIGKPQFPPDESDTQECPYPDDCMEECMEQMEEEEEENINDSINEQLEEEEEEEAQEEGELEDYYSRKAEDDYDDSCDSVTDKSLNRSSNRKQRNHHYTFDVDDNGLDINGFILHTDKHKGKRHKFRVHLDSNENGRFDKKDQLIGRTGLRNKHAAKGVGNLLDEGETGELIVDFKRPPSRRPDPDALTLDQQIQQLKNDIMNGGLDMQFKLPNGTSIPITLDDAKTRLSLLEMEQDAIEQEAMDLSKAMDQSKLVQDSLKNTFDPVCWIGDC